MKQRAVVNSSASDLEQKLTKVQRELDNENSNHALDHEYSAKVLQKKEEEVEVLRKREEAFDAKLKESKDELASVR